MLPDCIFWEIICKIFLGGRAPRPPQKPQCFALRGSVPRTLYPSVLFLVYSHGYESPVWTSHKLHVLPCCEGLGMAHQLDFTRAGLDYTNINPTHKNDTIIATIILANSQSRPSQQLDPADYAVADGEILTHVARHIIADRSKENDSLHLIQYKV